MQMTRLHVVCGFIVLLFCHDGSNAQQINGASQSASADTSAKQGSSEPKAGFPASAVIAIEDSLKRIAEAQETQTAGGNSSDDKQDKKRDLAAQEDMAFWARAMFWAALVSLVITTIATALLIMTFRETRRATFAALRSAVAGRQSVRVSRQSAEKQLRAYLWREAVQDSLDDFSNGGFSVHSTIKNSGQTPAYDVHTWSRLQALPQDTREFESAPKTVEGPRFVIHPGSDHTFHTPTPDMHEGDRNDIHFGVKVLFVWGELRYRDAFNVDRRTRFRLFWMVHRRTPSGPRLGQWIYCDEGNDAT
jgi:hypothetical protein